MLFQTMLIRIVLLFLLSPVSHAHFCKTKNFVEQLSGPKLSFKFVDGGSKKVDRELLTLFLDSCGGLQDLAGTRFLVDSAGVHPLETCLGKVFQAFPQRHVALNISLEDEEHTPIWILLRFLLNVKASSDPNKEITVFILTRPKWILNPYSLEKGK
jgi:hypothetical protein